MGDRIARMRNHKRLLRIGSRFERTLFDLLIQLVGVRTHLIGEFRDLLDIFPDSLDKTREVEGQEIRAGEPQNGPASGLGKRDAIDKRRNVDTDVMNEGTE